MHTSLESEMLSEEAIRKTDMARYLEQGDEQR